MYSNGLSWGGRNRPALKAAECGFGFEATDPTSHKMQIKRASFASPQGWWVKKERKEGREEGKEGGRREDIFDAVSFLLQKLPSDLIQLNVTSTDGAPTVDPALCQRLAP